MISRRRFLSGLTAAVDRNFTPRFDSALQVMKELPYGKVARVRSRGHAAVLRVAPARGRDDQVQSAEAPRPGDRLGVS